MQILTLIWWRQFILGLMTLIPWTAILFFDFALYVCHMVLYEFPLIGGRARGARRPRAPSISQRLDGGQRTGFALDANGDEAEEDITGENDIKGERTDEKENIKIKERDGGDGVVQ